MKDTSHELDWNPGDVSSILNFAEDTEQLTFGFCVPLNMLYPCYLYTIEPYRNHSCQNWLLLPFLQWETQWKLVSVESIYVFMP